MERKIIVFDTTLRDGEQVPGAKLNPVQKLEIALQLEKLGVDVIEAGFPISSPGDEQAVRMVAEKVKGPIIAGLARVLQPDIDAAWRAVQVAERPRIHVFLGASDIHVQKKLRMDREKALNLAVEAVQYAKKYCPDVEYSTEDAARTDFIYLCKVVKAVIEAGATTVNIPDTVGYAYPEEFGPMIERLQVMVPELEDVVLSVHCHNDLGLAVANSLAAIRHGAQQVECTINGIGERAGNASLEEIVMAFKTRPTVFKVHTSINTKEISRTSRMVSRLMNIPVQPNKAIVGANAFAHSAGIHQDGILKDRSTYEIMRPEDVGIKEHTMVLTARSGRAAVRHELKDLGFELDEDMFVRVFTRFMEVADRKKEIASKDLRSIAEVEMTKVPETYSFVRMKIAYDDDSIRPQATVELQNGDLIKSGIATGNGPINAGCRAVDEAIGLRGELLRWDGSGVTYGKDALGEITVQVEIEGSEYMGVGTSPDVIEASVRAYINAFNRYFANNV